VEVVLPLLFLHDPRGVQQEVLGNHKFSGLGSLLLRVPRLREREFKRTRAKVGVKSLLSHQIDRAVVADVGTIHHGGVIPVQVSDQVGNLAPESFLNLSLMAHALEALLLAELVPGLWVPEFFDLEKASQSLNLVERLLEDLRVHLGSVELRHENLETTLRVLGEAHLIGRRTPGDVNGVVLRHNGIVGPDCGL